MSHESGAGSIEIAFQLDRERHLQSGDLDGWRVSSLIYADWLEENGRDADAATIRADADTRHPPRLSEWPDPARLPGLTAHQREQLAVALRRPLGILCGSPGTGKTHVAATLATQLPAQHLAVCAPTGKAATRIAEVIRATDPATTIGASTIHQLLRISRPGHDGGGWEFAHNQSNPLPYRFVILDEPSMLSADLAADLFRALRPGTHLLLVGDPDQLPPVGHGAPLRDLIASGVVPVGRLTEIHRNGGAIAAACAAIREGRQNDVLGYATVSHPGKVDLVETILQVTPSSNWLHLEAASPERAVERLRELLTWERPVIHASYGLPDSIQILAPVREKGPLSCATINRLCQEVLNPDDPHDPGEARAWGTRIRPGDRVVCLHNHWANAAANDTRATHYVANGETGVVLSTDQTIIGEFGGNRIRMRRGGDEDFALGYCVTVHKFQGSEIPVSIVLLDGWHGRNVIGREWIYTALSRARSLCITIGRLWTVHQAVAEQRLEVRRTFLDARIREGMVHGTA